MEDVKSALLSRTVWAALIGIVASLIGLNLDAQTQASAVDLAVQAVTLISAVVALYGRVVATKRLRP